MEKYIALLIFVVPGFLARYFIDEFLEKDEIKSELEKTLTSLIYGLPIWIISLLIIVFFMDIDSVTKFKESLNSLVFILEYITVTFISTLLFSICILIFEFKFKVPTTKKILNLINPDKKIADEENCWKEFLKQKPDGKILGVFKGNEEIATGVLKHNSPNNCNRSELILIKISLTESVKESLEVDKIYIDIKNDIILKEYVIKEDES